MENNTDSFIVRIWQESPDQQGTISEWRGSIDHVGKNKRLYFNDPERIGIFIQEQIGWEIRQPTPWWRLISKWIRNGIKRIHV